MFKSKLTYRLAKMLMIAFTASVAMVAQSGTVDASYKEFVVSAYYSPLPGQSAYVTGTYAGDIRLNGGGVRTASGVLVEEAPGCFLASPPEYAFGTIMELEGIGQCVVLDRGGAFKNGLLRLDMWLGYGDEGRAAAMQWGLRRVGVEILGDLDEPNLANGYNNYSTLQSYQQNLSESPLTFASELEIGDSGENVARLQQILKDLKFFNGEVNGSFDEDTSNAIETFQLNQGLISDPAFREAGRFGVFTIEKLDEKVARIRDEYFEYVPSRNLGRGAKGEDVRKLQDLLYRLGYMESVSGLYDATTVKAVMQFQIDQGIILDSSDQAAGYFGPNTQYALDRVFYLMENNVIEDLKDSIEASEDLSFTNVETTELLVDGLDEGDSGEEVKKLQELLRSINYLRIDPTGYYGPLTAHAVYKFQQKVGIVEASNDAGAGVVGPKTRTALNKFMNTRNSLTAQYTDQVDVVVYDFSEELSLGDRGRDVKRLQNFLKEKGYFIGTLTTEYFGEITKRSLIAYQADNNLDQTGELDSSTIKLLSSRS